MSYKEGDYFGERALLKNEPRAANVVAQSKLKVAQIDRGSFMRLLGPLDNILARNMEAYSKFMWRVKIWVCTKTYSQMINSKI